MTTYISFSTDSATLTVDGELNVWLGWFALAAFVAGAILCLKIDVFLFTVAGWLFIALLPFAIYEFLKVSPNLSYKYVINRTAQTVSRKNVAQGDVNCKTGEFLDIQLLSTITPGRTRIRIYYIQLRCENGVVWLSSNFSNENASQVAVSLARWLDLELKPAMEISYAAALTTELLIPRYNPWKPVK